ncbi:MAG TPA: 3-oxoacyl-[acyl-carrier-protein] synthase III C-terminal domain-containing protein [Xanthobacteraceae bacterium]|jgi:alkylresorcinol/alkylpyrone synthase|nr:3-oxoacyl-[acyl-carrier-protein] synthase III C-terminal domain-containing protein [Xanthobacteraceae bacterium]
MLEVLKSQAVRTAATAGFDVEILAMATANPPHILKQADAAERVKKLYPHLKGLFRLFDNTGIETRYNSEPVDWYLSTHTWEERTASFQKNALDLLAQVTLAVTDKAGVAVDAIDMIITNTVTGLAIPSLDARLFNRLGLNPTIERLPMFGLGCGAGVAGLARAARLAQAKDGAHVLFLTVDLCSLCLRINDPSPAMFVSSALFGDGAAGVLVHNTRGGARGGPRILATGEWCWRETEYIMGWDIKDDGFGVVLSPELPSLMSEKLAPALQDFLDRNGFKLSDFNGFLFHPGGRKLIETMEDVLGLGPDQLNHSREVLRHYGNMSSATALFVLDRALKAGARGPHLLAAFGPGFSAYFVAADL